ncbi:hypothetical protein [Dyadobacter sp. 3J3]|uniref:hypothetical protein n=1 Tax=Dyadobacter sp. 3J3 TaxID=2606600 RepID=UPI00190F3E14
MSTCLENDIKTFDQADIYGDYTTEADFGNAFLESKMSREMIQLVSKYGSQMQSERRKTRR